MKYTLLEMVQTILSSMDSDEVDSISDTPEAYQVAVVIRTAYMDVISRSDLPEHFDLVQLEETDATTPVKMTLPDEVANVLWLRYNKETTGDTDLQMREVIYKPLPEFLNSMYAIAESGSNVETFSATIGSATVPFLYYNDKAPSYYTSYDDYTIIFDSYDSTVDTYLTGAKTLAYARTVIPFSMTDNFTPDLDEGQFALLLNEAKSLAWAELKQTQHAKAEQAARRGWTRLERTKHKVAAPTPLDAIPDYGRGGQVLAGKYSAPASSSTSTLTTVSWANVTGKPDLETTSTDNAIVRFDGVSGGTQDSGVTINDSGTITGIAGTWTGIHQFDNRLTVLGGNNIQLNDSTNTNGFWLHNASAKLGVNFNNGTDLFAFRSNGTYVTFAAGTAAAGVNGSTTWLNASPYLIGVDAAGAVTNYAISPNGQYATVNATRASDNAAVSQTNVIADAAVIAGDHATLTHNVWARYTHAVKTAGAAAGLRLIGEELSAINLGSVVASDPYNPNPSGLTEGMRITSGYGDAANALSAALMIKDNGGEFNSGIVFGSDAFDLAATPIPDAIAFAEPFAITWFSAAATKRWQIYSDATNHDLNVAGAGSLRVGSGTGGGAITALAETAIPAGGTTGAGIKMSSTANLGVFFGSGVPTLSAAQGSLYLRTDGSSTSTRMYVNTNGTTGWTAVTTAT